MTASVDWLTATATATVAAATVAVAVGTMLAWRANRQLVRVTRAMVDEARRDRELGVQPLLIVVSQNTDPQGPSVTLQNIGRGRAIATQCFLSTEAGGVYYNSAEPVLDISVPTPLVLDRHLRPGQLAPGLSPDEPGLVVACSDLLGNALLFDLVEGTPPRVSRPGAPLELWVHARVLLRLEEILMPDGSPGTARNQDSVDQDG